MAVSYRLGISIVVGTVIASALLCLGLVRSPGESPRAAQDLGNLAQNLGSFELKESSGRKVTDVDLARRTVIASFIFTRCQLSCPRISSIMKSLQGRLEGTEVLLVSISVDPEHDTPEVLKDYARGFSALPDRWWFLTGSRSTIFDLLRERFHLSVMENPAPSVGAEEIAHSDRLALIDHGKIVGLFDSKEPAALTEIVARSRRLSLPSWVRRLPGINASLNALCAVFLITGWLLIRRSRVKIPPDSPRTGEDLGTSAHPFLLQPRVRAHRACMVSALATSALFLGSYLVYHYHAGSVPFRGQGLFRLIYFTLLLSHTVLATFGVVPLVLMTVLKTLRRDFAGHARIASVTFPIWLYVSITGVLVYLMLYQLPVVTSPYPLSAISV